MEPQLQGSTALVVGLGGLGCPVALDLAEAGVGRLVLLDPDAIETSNLQRQVLFGTGDEGRPKVEVAAERLRLRAPGIAVDTVRERLEPSNADAHLDGCDVVVDATDSSDTRFVVNDHALAHRVPAVIGGAIRFEGMVVTLGAGHGPCLRCLFEGAPTADEVGSCAVSGILGAMAGVVGHVEASRALGLLRGEHPRFAGSVATLDGLRGRIREHPIPPGGPCRTCGGVRRRLDLRGEGFGPAHEALVEALAATSPGQAVEAWLTGESAGRSMGDALRDAGYPVALDGPAGEGRHRVVARAPRSRATSPLGVPGERDRSEVQPTTEERRSMEITIRIPTALRKFVDGQEAVTVEGRNVAEALDQLESRHPGIKAKICDDEGNLRRFINVYADQEDIRFLDNLRTELQQGSELQILPAIAGGC